MKFEIKNRWSGELIFSVEAENWRFAVEAAIKAKANLSGANLSGANLSKVNLSGADLSGANLSVIKNDFWAVLLHARNEVIALRKSLIEGNVDGSTYEGSCACLVGTIAKAKGCKYDSIPDLTPQSSRPAERFFLAIRQGDTHENNQCSKLAVEWIDEWVSFLPEVYNATSDQKTIPS